MGNIKIEAPFFESRAYNDLRHIEKMELEIKQLRRERDYAVNVIENIAEALLQGNTVTIKTNFKEVNAIAESSNDK